MKLNRRELLAQTGLLAATAKWASAAAPAKGSSSILAKSDFPIAESQTYLNCAGWHPTPAASARAMKAYVDFKNTGKIDGKDTDSSMPVPEMFARVTRSKEVKELFAKLVNAKPTEIAYAQSTMAGESVVIEGLGLPRGGGNVVTDALHFEGSLYAYKELEKQGIELRIAKPRDGRVEIRDLEKLVDKKTRLVAVSLVSFVNGYKQDIKAVADLAHAHGAYAYADIIQAAGCIPVNLHETGIDCAACGSYKWLMGDMGLGFLYVREDLQGKIVKSTQHGWKQYRDFEYHMFPGDPPAASPFTYERLPEAAGYYELGTIANSITAGLWVSLQIIQKLGVENIRAHTKPLTDRLQKELPAMGYVSMTPPDNPTPIVAFIVKDPEATIAKLKKASVTAKVVHHQLRISPSVFNDQQDIDKLLNALA
jgi:selenocysteine lyase/cysteine desulfurase